MSRLVFVLLTCGAHAQDDASAPRLEGWLAETLRIDTAKARACYERGASGRDENERVLCAARLAELAAA
ncbi:MAG: hypothetical protein KDB80_10500, partial [Planctomycetes bacterium]|nr:hypothetical protein [Planctomycetota bacterium]